MAALLQFAYQAAQTHPVVAAGLYSTSALFAAGRHYAPACSEWARPHVVKAANYVRRAVERHAEHHVDRAILKVTPEDERYSKIVWLHNLGTRFMASWYTMWSSIWTVVLSYGLAVWEFVSWLFAFLGKVWFVLRTTAYWSSVSVKEDVAAQSASYRDVWTSVCTSVSSRSMNAWEKISARVTFLGDIRASFCTALASCGFNGWNYIFNSGIAVHDAVMGTASSVFSWMFDHITSSCNAVADAITRTTSSVFSFLMPAISTPAFKNTPFSKQAATTSSGKISAITIIDSVKRNAADVITGVRTSAAATIDSIKTNPKATLSDYSPQSYTTNVKRSSGLVEKAALIPFNSIKATTTAFLAETTTNGDYNWFLRGGVFIPATIFLFSYVFPKVRRHPIPAYRLPLYATVLVTSSVGVAALGQGQPAVWARDLGLLAVGALASRGIKIKEERLDDLVLRVRGASIIAFWRGVHRLMCAGRRIRTRGAILFHLMDKALRRLIEGLSEGLTVVLHFMMWGLSSFHGWSRGPFYHNIMNGLQISQRWLVAIRDWISQNGTDAIRFAIRTLDDLAGTLYAFALSLSAKLRQPQYYTSIAVVVFCAASYWYRSNFLNAIHHVSLPEAPSITFPQVTVAISSIPFPTLRWLWRAPTIALLVAFPTLVLITGLQTGKGARQVTLLTVVLVSSMLAAFGLTCLPFVDSGLESIPDVAVGVVTFVTLWFVNYSGATGSLQDNTAVLERAFVEPRTIFQVLPGPKDGEVPAPTEANGTKRPFEGSSGRGREKRRSVEADGHVDWAAIQSERDNSSPKRPGMKGLLATKASAERVPTEASWAGRFDGTSREGCSDIEKAARGAKEQEEAEQQLEAEEPAPTPAFDTTLTTSPLEMDDEEDTTPDVHTDGTHGKEEESPAMPLNADMVTNNVDAKRDNALIVDPEESYKEDDPKNGPESTEEAARSEEEATMSSPLDIEIAPEGLHTTASEDVHAETTPEDVHDETTLEDAHTETTRQDFYTETTPEEVRAKVAPEDLLAETASGDFPTESAPADVHVESTPEGLQAEIVHEDIPAETTSEEATTSNPDDADDESEAEDVSDNSDGISDDEDEISDDEDEDSDDEDENSDDEAENSDEEDENSDEEDDIPPAGLAPSLTAGQPQSTSKLTPEPNQPQDPLDPASIPIPYDTEYEFGDDDSTECPDSDVSDEAFIGPFRASDVTTVTYDIIERMKAVPAAEMRALTAMDLAVTSATSEEIDAILDIDNMARRDAASALLHPEFTGYNAEAQLQLTQWLFSLLRPGIVEIVTTVLPTAADVNADTSGSSAGPLQEEVNTLVKTLLEWLTFGVVTRLLAPLGAELPAYTGDMALDRTEATRRAAAANAVPTEPVTWTEPLAPETIAQIMASRAVSSPIAGPSNSGSSSTSPGFASPFPPRCTDTDQPDEDADDDASSSISTDSSLSGTDSENPEGPRKPYRHRAAKKLGKRVGGGGGALPEADDAQPSSPASDGIPGREEPVCSDEEY